MVAGLDALLARHRTISIAALVALILIAWGWLIAGAGMEMGPQFSFRPADATGSGMAGMAGMPGMADMPGMAMEAPSPWSAGHYALVFSMWWIMMVAMMLPSAAPTILLYGRVATRAHADVRPETGSFIAGYLVAWAVFSFIAALMQGLLGRLEFISPDMMVSQSRALSGAILIVAGIYQLSPLKNACLRHCQSPAAFLSRHYRPGPLGAFRMGALHGAFCIGCCWLLMALLFVGGIMNLLWIALLTAMVAAEKLLPFGRVISMALGLACLAWGGVLLFAR